MSMTRNEYAESIARRPRQMTVEQEYLLTTRRIVSDLTRHRRANERAQKLLDLALHDLTAGDTVRARNRVEQAIRALARVEAPTTSA